MQIDVERLVEHLLTWEGVPYMHQGRSREGVDCVGLGICGLREQSLATDVPFKYGRTALGEQLLSGLEESGLLVRQHDLQPMARGDVLAFRIRRDPQHVGIATSPTTFIHSDATAGVRHVDFSPLWQMRLVRRYSWTKT